MLITAIACRIGAHLYRHTIPWLSATYIFGTAAATLVGVAGLLSVYGIKTWDKLGPVLMVIPILYAIAARLYRGHALENPLAWAGQAATAVMLVAVLAASAHLTPQQVFEPTVGAPLNLSLALIAGGSGPVLPADGRVPQAGHERLSLCGDHVPCHLATACNTGKWPRNTTRSPSRWQGWCS